MPLVMVAILILFVMSAGLLSLSLRSRLFALRNASTIVARCAADAGMSKAVYEMNEKLKVTPWDDSFLPQVTGEVLPDGDASFDYRITGDLGSGYALESVGSYLLAERTVRCDLSLEGPFESAIFVQGALILKAGTTVDGYNSLDPGITDVELKIGTNSTLSNSIVLNAGVDVDGDVLAGFGSDAGDVIQNLGATTDGEYPLTQEIELPVITAPTLANKGQLMISGTTLTIGPTDSGQYNDISVVRATNPGILEVAGGDVVIHVVGNIDLGEACEIIVKPGASLTSYLDGDLLAGNDAGINNQGVPKDFQLYGTGTAQTITMKAKGDMSGSVYAPNADVTIMALGDIYGSFVSKSFEMKAGGNFYYDEALKEVSVDDEAVRFVVRGWSEE
jgi:hypothetical protein